MEEKSKKQRLFPPVLAAIAEEAVSPVNESLLAFFLSPDSGILTAIITRLTVKSPSVIFRRDCRTVYVLFFHSVTGMRT
ncbi:MAG: hypothetical protein AB1461_15570 [Thermodesulfobacteriota bacterium]